MPVALEALDPEILAGYSLKFVWRNSACSPGLALSAMTSLMKEDVDFFIGPACSVACEPTQLLVFIVLHFPLTHRSLVLFTGFYSEHPPGKRFKNVSWSTKY